MIHSAGVRMPRLGYKRKTRPGFAVGQDNHLSDVSYRPITYRHKLSSPKSLASNTAEHVMLPTYLKHFNIDQHNNLRPRQAIRTGRHWPAKNVLQSVSEAQRPSPGGSGST